MQLTHMLTEEQKMLQETLRKFVDKEIMPIREELENGNWKTITAWWRAFSRNWLIWESRKGVIPLIAAGRDPFPRQPGRLSRRNLREVMAVLP